MALPPGSPEALADHTGSTYQVAPTNGLSTRSPFGKLEELLLLELEELLLELEELLLEELLELLLEELLELEEELELQLEITPPLPLWLSQVVRPIQLWLFSQPQPVSWLSQSGRGSSWYHLHISSQAGLLELEEELELLLEELELEELELEELELLLELDEELELEDEPSPIQVGVTKLPSALP